MQLKDLLLFFVICVSFLCTDK